jgi:2-succinyl-6-hydroxy-2,4-cyclohexadiene-1-carboxylate synthase
LKKHYQFNYTLTGNDERPAIVWLHGFLGNLTDWDQLVNRFRDSYCCLALDLPGHGQTRTYGGQPAYSMPWCAEGIIGLLNELGIAKAHLIGYSMGGRLALYLAVNYPGYWHKIIIESASPGLPSIEEKKERWQFDQKLAARLKHGDFRQFLSDWYAQPVFGSLRFHPDFAVLQKNREQNNRLELSRSLRGMSVGKQPSLWNKLPQIKLPIMMLVGQNDLKYVRIGEMMQRVHPILNLKIVENCSHLVHFERPGLFGDLIESFLNKPEQV